MQNRVKKKFLFFLLVSCLLPITAQVPGMPAMALKEAKNVFGGTYDDRANPIVQTSDGGYIVAGSTGSNNWDVSGNHGGEDMWVVKLSGSGVLQWQKTLGGTGSDKAYSIVQTSDGGYAVAGLTSSNNGDIAGPLNGSQDFFIPRLDAARNVIRLYEDLP